MRAVRSADDLAGRGAVNGKGVKGEGPVGEGWGAHSARETRDLPSSGPAANSAAAAVVAGPSRRRAAGLHSLGGDLVTAQAAEAARFPGQEGPAGAQPGPGPIAPAHAFCRFPPPPR